EGAAARSTWAGLLVRHCSWRTAIQTSADAFCHLGLAFQRCRQQRRSPPVAFEAFTQVVEDTVIAATGLKPARLIVVLLGRRHPRMAENDQDDADVFWVVGGDRRCDTIPDEVRADVPAERGARVALDARRS